jgi:hypothetical protein
LRSIVYVSIFTLHEILTGMLLSASCAMFVIRLCMVCIFALPPVVCFLPSPIRIELVVWMTDDPWGGGGEEGGGTCNILWT